jgi:hypothetical protein
MDSHDELLRSEAERLGVDVDAVGEARRLMHADRATRSVDGGEGEERPGTLTANEFGALGLAHIWSGPTELWNGRVVVGGQEVVFSPAQVRAAAVLGMRVRSCLDALLEDPEAVAEARAALLARPVPQPKGDEADDEARRLALRRRFAERTLTGEGVTSERSAIGAGQPEAGHPMGEHEYTLLLKRAERAGKPARYEHAGVVLDVRRGRVWLELADGPVLNIEAPRLGLMLVRYQEKLHASKLPL